MPEIGTMKRLLLNKIDGGQIMIDYRDIYSAEQYVGDDGVLATHITMRLFGENEALMHDYVTVMESPSLILEQIERIEYSCE